MDKRITDALNEKYVISALIYLYGKGSVLKYRLKEVTNGWRRVDKLIDRLQLSRLIYVDDISVQDKKLYKVRLSNLGKRVVENLMDIHEPKMVNVVYRRGFHDNMLIALYETKPRTLNDLLKVGYIEEARGLLWELRQMGIVEIEQIPNGRFEDYPIHLTARGKKIAEKLTELEELVGGKFEGTHYQE